MNVVLEIDYAPFGMQRHTKDMLRLAERITKGYEEEKQINLMINNSNKC